MRKAISVWLCLVLLLGLTACTTDSQNPVADDPSLSRLTYDMTAYDSFSQIFYKNYETPWQDMGRYTLYLEGLGTPVTAEMDGLDLLSVSAYDRTLEVNLGTFQGDVNAEIQAYDGAVILNDCEDHAGNTWILTEKKVYEFHPEGDISTQVYVGEDGTLCYRRFLGDYYTSFNHWDTAPLDLCSARDEFVFESGRAAIQKETVVLTPKKTLVLSDLYDLDALFAEAKGNGMYEAYDTVDELFEANKNKAE